VSKAFLPESRTLTRELIWQQHFKPSSFSAFPATFSLFPDTNRSSFSYPAAIMAESDSFSITLSGAQLRTNVFARQVLMFAYCYFVIRWLDV